MKVEPNNAPDPSGGSQREFDKSFVRSVAWTGIAKGISQFFGWIATFIVARLLTPEDYGLVGMATIFLGLVMLVSESGIGITIVTIRDLEQGQIEQFNTIAALLGLVGFAVCAAAAVPLGKFFQSEELPLVLLVLGVTFPITGIRTIPRAVLQLELRFKLLGALEVINVLVLSASMVAFAVYGFRYWTLVLGALISASVTTLLTVWFRPQRFRWPQWESLRGALTFTKHQLGGSLLWYTYSHADQVVAGRVLGQGDLGIYSLAMSIVNSIPEKITSIVTGVTPAFFSALQDKPAELKRYLLRLTEILSVVTFPALFGLAVVADDLVAFALGEKWSGVTVPLRILAIYAAINATSQLMSRVLTVRGESRFLVMNGALIAVVMPISFVFGSQWGPAGIAAAWAIVFPFTRIALFRRLALRIDISAREYFGAFWPAMSSCTAMVVAVLLLRALLPVDLALSLRLSFEVLSGALVYVLVVFYFHRERVEILLKLRSAWRKERNPAELESEN